MEYTFILADAAAGAASDSSTQATGDASQASAGGNATIEISETSTSKVQEQPASGSNNSQWIILIVLFAAMYFLLIAPQRKREKLRRKMLAETKVGDNVITIGGICGVITNKSDKTYILRVSDTAKIEVLISAVNQNLTQEEAAAAAVKTVAKK